jgi:hypothetical protein
VLNEDCARVNPAGSALKIHYSFVTILPTCLSHHQSWRDFCLRTGTAQKAAPLRHQIVDPQIADLRAGHKSEKFYGYFVAADHQWSGVG